MKRSLNALAVALTLTLSLAAPARAQSEASRASLEASTWSALSFAGAASVLGQGASELVVSAINTTGESTALVLKNVSDGSVISVRVSAKTLSDAGVAIGSAVQVSADASGYALIAAGKMIAFIPNELGRALLGSSRTSQR